jgi:hypothetical protein
MNKFKLSELIETIQFQSDGLHAFINLKNNSICLLSDSAISYVEDEDTDYPDWQKEEIQLAHEYLEDSSSFIELPDQYDLNEYNMMEDFIDHLGSDKNTEKLSIAISGKGAFRRFKDTVINLGIADDWYKYRDEQYKQFILEWCKQQKIELEL